MYKNIILNVENVENVQKQACKCWKSIEFVGVKWNIHGATSISDGVDGVFEFILYILYILYILCLYLFVGAMAWIVAILQCIFPNYQMYL